MIFYRSYDLSNIDFFFILATLRAKVLFDYDAEQEDELTLAVGDIVTNIEKQDEGWWEGEVHGKRGLFPENFVEVIDEKPMNGKFIMLWRKFFKQILHMSTLSNSIFRKDR